MNMVIVCFFRVMKCSDINCNDSYITVNILKIIELYILSRYCMA